MAASADVTFGLKEPFDIDRGELDGIAPHQCFVLGVEWCMVFQQLESGKAFTRTINSYNIPRLRALCERHERIFSIEPITDHDDWAELTVEEL